MTSVESGTLKKQRGLIKAGVTRIKNYVDSITEVNREACSQLHERRTKLDVFWNEYNKVQYQLELIDERNEGPDRIAFEESFYQLAAKIRCFLFPSHQMPTAATSATPTSNLSEVSANIRLPKLNLPSFSGNYEDWFPFFDTFQSVIHNNPSLNDTQRFQYLRASLTGDAANTISALELSDVNYDVAWGILKERYDNKRAIVHAHLKALRDLPIMSKESTFELRQIVDGASRHVRALSALKRPTNYWDDLLLFNLTAKLDKSTAKDWQASLTGNELPSFKQFIGFLNHKCQTLEATSSVPGQPGPLKSNSPSGNVTLGSQGKRLYSSHVATIDSKCHYCGGAHPIYYCKNFLALSVAQRQNEIRKRGLCTNCMRTTNRASIKCPSGKCKECGAKPNSLLHLGKQGSSSMQSGSPKDNDISEASSSKTTISAHSSISFDGKNVLLSTASVYLLNSQGKRVLCRALLDSGSQANFMTRECLNRLNLKTRAFNIAITGINQTASVANHIVCTKIQSRVNAFQATINCIITDRITDQVPTTRIDRNLIHVPANLKLADPQFYVPSNIDILIGAELFWELLSVGQIKPSLNGPIIQKTRLGWILAGRLNYKLKQQFLKAFHVSVRDAQLQNQLTQFWELESLDSVSGYSRDEQQCEDHFLRNVTQDQYGRCIVKLPIKPEVLRSMGDSKQSALRRFCSLERRFKLNEDLKTRYAEFIQQYLSLGHMKLISTDDNHDDVSFYLPHHCVFKETSLTTKIRVVFDGSAKSTTGISLNDALMVGPVVQQDLLSIVIRFRTFMYALTDDIVNMYRQVLAQWAIPHWNSVHVIRDFYVDDLLTGADSIDEIKRIQFEVRSLLKLGAFELSQWSSNIPELCDEALFGTQKTIDIKECNSRILGIQWNPKDDYFSFKVQTSQAANRSTKRIILSEMSRIFDPLGLLSPVIITAKIILQGLWQANVHWDESLPLEIHTQWSNLKSRLHHLNHIRIPRCVKFNVDRSRIQLHGFCDASTRAYGACVYVRTEMDMGHTRVELLVAKSRVAPIKAVSLPRLELCGAVLLSHLIHKIRSSITFSAIDTFLWCDSTIVLHWIASSSRQWSTFVSNRIGDIQTTTQGCLWRHVPSKENPADLVSRGICPSQLAGSESWWHGPMFLKQADDHWPSQNTAIPNQDLLEARKVITTIGVIRNSIIDELLDKFSSLNKICRILSYCLRSLSPRHARPTDMFISPTEMDQSLRLICKLVQRSHFIKEYDSLTLGKPIKTTSSLLSLNPFCNKEGIIRVGGRLKNSQASADFIHPILLPKNHKFTHLFIRHEHESNLHAGIQATIASVRQRFWPLSVRSIVRKIINRCMVCFKCKPSNSESLMGELPTDRVTPSRPFTCTGIDYAGPILLREGKRRNATKIKAYVATFVCFATKAIHIELVSDLTSDAFIASLNRFISRRGRPARIYSDNGTNFVGASRALKEMHDFIIHQQVNSKFRQLLLDQGVEWIFIPPGAPHFGGLWEASVKSAKFHLHRIVGNASLNFEELQTVLCQIESTLNSRPLCPLSSDPNDLMCLTPGHFLIGTALNNLPNHDFTNTQENRLSRWQRLEQMNQHFWNRWSCEYLSQLQERHKWRQTKGEILKPGRLALIKQAGTNLLQWILGRVESIHPGSDNIARSATIKTKTAVLVRPLSKLAILPELD